MYRRVVRVHASRRDRMPGVLNLATTEDSSPTTLEDLTLVFREARGVEAAVELNISISSPGLTYRFQESWYVNFYK